MNTTTRLIGSSALLLASLGAAAQPRDPWLPPAARSAPLAEPTRGAALQAQVRAKLAAQFQRADAAGRGALTRAEAQRAGWGFAVRHFDAIDAGGRGEIRIADVDAFVAGERRRVAR